MSFEEIKSTVDKIGQSVAEMQAKHKEEIEALKKQNPGLSADELTEKMNGLAKEGMEKANQAIDALQKRYDDLEAAMKRSSKASEQGQTPEQKEYSDAYFGEKGYIRKGMKEAQLIELGQKAMSTLSDPDGGYFVPVATSDQVSKILYETSPVRQYANSETLSTDSIEGPVDNDEADAGWVGETVARTETATPQMGQWKIEVHELYAQPKATQKLLDDSAVNIEQWLQNKIVEKFARIENAAFVNGNGILKPRGFLTYPSGTNYGQIEQVVTGSAAALTANGIVNLETALKGGYRQGAAYFMSRTTLGKVRLLVDGQGNYLWQPNYQAGQPQTLNGYPVVIFDDMPAVAANALSLAFGNLRTAYTIVDRQGVRVLRDAYTAKPYVLFYTTKRVGGDVLNFEALKLQKVST